MNNPIAPPAKVVSNNVRKGGWDSIPAGIPTNIAFIWRGIITSKAPKKGIKRTIKITIKPIPIKAPRTIPSSMFKLGGMAS